MCEGKLPGERAEGLPACLLSSKMCSTGEKCCCILAISGFFQACGCVCGETRTAATGERGCAAAIQLQMSHRARLGAPGCAPPSPFPGFGSQVSTVPRNTGPTSLQGKGSSFQKSECFVSVSHSINSTPTPSIGSLPKKQSERSIEAPYILHVIPCLNPS